MTSERQPVDLEGLNQEFYSGDPAGYFRIRLNMLLLAAGCPDDVQTILERGVRYGGMVTMPLARSSEERDDLLLSYLVTESQALLHHVSEALLRLFLAHASPTRSPWIEVASLRDFKKFKQQAEVIASPHWPAALQDALPVVFLGGTPTEPTVSGDDPIDSITRLLRHLAAGLLEDSNLYNSVKHGMAAIASQDAYIRVATSEGEAIMASHGPSVAFLESSVADDERTWKVTRRGVSIRRAMWLSQLALMEIDALWALGRARYCGAELAGVQVVTREAVNDGISGAFADRGGISTWSRTVAIEQLPARPPKGPARRTRPKR